MYIKVSGIILYFIILYYMEGLTFPHRRSKEGICWTFPYYLRRRTTQHNNYTQNQNLLAIACKLINYMIVI